MPKWSLEGDALLQVVQSGATRALPKPPAFDIRVLKGADQQLSSRIEELLRGAGTAGEGTLVVSQTRGAAGLVGLEGGAGGLESAGKLEKARQRIEARDYEEALRILEEILVEFTTHPEAVYLKGLCEHSLGDSEKALETIAGLRSGAESSLGTRVQILRAQTRQSIAPRVAMEVMDAPTVAIAHLERLVVLDPQGGVYHLLLVRCLVDGGRLEAARTALRRAEPLLEGQYRTVLEGLAARLERLLVEQDLAAAREFYRSRQYRKARKELDRVRSTWGGHALWRAFRDYLEDLGSGAFSRPLPPEEVVPRGGAAEVEDLHLFLAGDEIRRAGALIESGDFTGARMVLEGGLALAPHFAYLHFLVAGSGFKQLWLEVSGGTPPEPEEFARRLEGLRMEAEAGARDPQMAEAGELLRAIASSVDAYREIREQTERDRREAEVFGPLTRELAAIVESSGDGIRSVDHFHELRGRLEELDQSAKVERVRVRSEQGRTRLGELLTVIARYLERLNEIEPEIVTAEEIGAYHRQLERVLERVRGGISSREEMERFEAQLGNLRLSVAGYRQAHSQLAVEAAAALDQLCTEIESCRKRLAEVMGEIADAAVLGGHAGTLRRILGTQRSVRGLVILREDLAALRSTLEQVRTRLRSEQGRKRCAELVAAVESALSEIGE